MLDSPEPMRLELRFPIQKRLRILLIVAFSCSLITVMNCASAIAQDSPKSLNYLVDLSEAKNHYVTITADVPAAGKTTELMMAVWTPGSYLIREYARNIDSLSVAAIDGTKLEFEKSRKNRWLVQTKNVKRFKVTYRLYCNELSVRTNWVGNEFAILNGAATFITEPGELDAEHVVELKLPRNWTRSATSLHADGKSPHAYRAENFDELVDSPIVAGNIDIYPFEADGVEHQLVNVGDSGYWDGTKAATDLKQVVEEHQRMWGTVPYDRYLFLNVIAESGGGLEHDNCSLIMTSQWSFRDEKRYKDWLSLASHEFFHAWNVRRLRPKSLIEYDYENEVYTESLWIAEGITSYYEDLALVRAGLITGKEFLERLSNNIQSTQSENGRSVQSLKDSSYDSWIKFYRPDENSSNTRISYYSKGAVVAFLLDAKIRQITGGKKSLDDVMQAMFEKFAKTGFTPVDFRKTAGDTAGVDLTDWFKVAVDSTTELDFQDIESLGLQFTTAKSSAESESKQTKTNGAAEDKSVAEPADIDAEEKSEGSDKEKESAKPKAWLGIRTSDQNGALVVSSVQSNSPATEAGINFGDEIIAINDFRVSNSLDSRLKQYEVGDEIQLLISRRGQLSELPVTIGAEPKQEWKLKQIPKPSKAQSAQLKAWLER